MFWILTDPLFSWEQFKFNKLSGGYDYSDFLRARFFMNVILVRCKSGFSGTFQERDYSRACDPISSDENTTESPDGLLFEFNVDSSLYIFFG